MLDRHLSLDHLRDRLEDLPLQFATPQVRSWEPIDWHTINADQLVGLDLDVFLAILQGAMDTEAPIRHYTQISGAKPAITPHSARGYQPAHAPRTDLYRHWTVSGRNRVWCNLPLSLVDGAYHRQFASSVSGIGSRRN